MILCKPSLCYPLVQRSSDSALVVTTPMQEGGGVPYSFSSSPRLATNSFVGSWAPGRDGWCAYFDSTSGSQGVKISDPTGALTPNVSSDNGESLVALFRFYLVAPTSGKIRTVFSNHTANSSGWRFNINADGLGYITFNYPTTAVAKYPFGATLFQPNSWYDVVLFFRYTTGPVVIHYSNKDGAPAYSSTSAAWDSWPGATTKDACLGGYTDGSTSFNDILYLSEFRAWKIRYTSTASMWAQSVLAGHF